MRTLILSLFVLCISFSTLAQQHDRREKIKALKVSFITEKLDLTESEAQKFWPIYNIYEKNTFKTRHIELRNIGKKIKENSSTLTDAECQVLLDELIAAEKKLYEENTQLIIKLKKIISPKKIILLKAAEEDFKKKLFDEYRKKRHGGEKRK